MEQLPPHLRRKLRQYRFAYWSLATAETICLGAILLAFLEPPALLLAILWLGWKLLRSPTDRAIAARIEEQHPELREQLVSVVELSRHADGSPDLRHEAFAEVDRAVADVEIGPLLSLRPVALLMILAVISNAAVGVQRQKELAHVGAPFRARPDQPASTESRPEGRSQKLTLAELADALRAQPDSVLAKLPAYARSLDAAVRQAAATGAEAEALRAQAAETLAEFARLAREIPELAALAAAASVLADELAATGRALVTQAPAGFTNTTTTARTPPVMIELALPGMVTGPVWQPPAVAVSFSAERVPTQYQAAVRGYFEKLAADSD